MNENWPKRARSVANQSRSRDRSRIKERMMRRGPFSDVIVIDLTHVLSGPYCTMYLAEMGARVIKVEHAGHGDETRAFPPFFERGSVYFASVNRGKESIALDFDKPEDRELLLEMIRRADVVVENLRFVTLEHLGLDYEHLQRINPRLIYAAISGFGQTGPFHERPAYDPILQAMGGMMSINGQPDGPPTKVGVSLIDYFSGMFCLAGIEAALYHRTKTGEGSKVDIGMLDAQMAVLEVALMNVLNGGPLPQRIGNRHPAVKPCDTFAASDRPIFIIAANDGLWQRLCEAIDRPELNDDPRFNSVANRAANESALKHELEQALAHHTAGHWQKVLTEAGVPCSLINTVQEAVGLPQIAARNMIVSAGEVRMAGNPIKLSAFPDPPTREPAPDLDAQGRHIRAEFKPTS
jgi:CoA:oxalate CoA-transferase